MKFLGIYFTIKIQTVQDLYIENYKTLQKVIKENLKKWKSISCLCMERFSIAVMFILLKLVFRVNTISVKIAAGLFVETHKLI